MRVFHKIAAAFGISLVSLASFALVVGLALLFMDSIPWMNKPLAEVQIRDLFGLGILLCWINQLLK